MDIEDYQFKARQTAIYPAEQSVIYPMFGLVGELGEFCNKYKKIWRDGREFPVADMVSELGDVLWYYSNLCSDLGLTLEQISETNVEKLLARQEHNTLHGDGDNR